MARAQHSGFRPHGKNVLIRCDECSPKTMGGLALTDDRIERMTAASETGCIFAIGPDALRLHEDGQKWDGFKPQVAERVFFERHAGTMCRGATATPIASWTTAASPAAWIPGYEEDQ